MNNFKIENLFPTGVVCSENRYKLNQKELDFVDSFRSNPKQMTTNARSQNQYVLQSPEMANILKFISQGLQFYIDNIIVPKEKLELYITQSWLNYTEPGQSHHYHKHTNSIISGVFYVNAEPSNDKIYFHKNSPYERITILPGKFNPYNSQSWWLPISTGQLVLFDSSVHHSVETTTSSDTRISLAFNTFVKGYLGDEEALTALYLK